MDATGKTNRDTMIPGGVYLCQPDEKRSCGACCGLYNLTDISRQSLEALLIRRTTEFSTVKRELQAMDAFAGKETERLGKPRPFEALHHCPFIGLIGTTKNRVGCLLHPLAQGNDGIDYRGLSYYGGMACRDFFCTTTHTLAPAAKLFLRNLNLDWYAYGLIVTETTLHQALFDEIEKRIGGSFDWNLAQHDKTIRNWCETLLTLKLNWPYRDPRKSLCHYLFSDAQHQRTAIDYARLKIEPSRYDTIFRELDSAFETQKDLKSAETLLDQILTLPQEAP